jgi:hypothetical protein
VTTTAQQSTGGDEYTTINRQQQGYSHQPATMTMATTQQSTIRDEYKTINRQQGGYDSNQRVTTTTATAQQHNNTSSDEYTPINR